MPRLLSRIALGFAFALSMLALPACADELRIGLSAEVTTLDPHWNNSGPNVALDLHLYEPLTLTDPKGRLIPGLATSWRNVDPLTWEFKLRQGVKFHDGSELTADDVLFSLERPNTLTGSPGPFTQFVKAIASKEAVDKYTVRIKTATPYVLMPYDLNSVVIVSKKLATGASTADFDSGKAAIGTGPFKLVRFARDDRIELVRNDAYWGAKPVWDKVTFRLLKNDASRLSALLAGELDAIENVPTQDIANLRKDTRFQIDQQTSWRTLFWHMDQFRDNSPDISDKSGKPLTKNPLRDARVRLAISKSINREAITSRVMEGLAVPASNLVSPGIFGYNASLKVEAYDPDGAKKLLADAGYPNGFAMTIHSPSGRYLNDEKVAQAVASFLSRIGITAKVETLPWSAYLPKARAGDFSFALVGWGSSLGDNTIKSHLATPNEAKGYGTWNFGRSSNPQVDALLDKDFQIFDMAEREESAKNLMAVALKDTPVIPLQHTVVSWAVRKGIHYPGRVDEFTLAHQFVKQ